MRDVIEVKRVYEYSLLEIPGVVGVAADIRTNEVVVFTETREDCLKLPRIIEGYRVRCKPIGIIKPL